LSVGFGGCEDVCFDGIGDIVEALVDARVDVGDKISHHTVVLSEFIIYLVDDKISHHTVVLSEFIIFLVGQRGGQVG